MCKWHWALLVCVATAVVRRLVTTSATAMRSDSSLSPRCTSGLEWRMALEGHRSRACRRNSVVLSPAPQSPEQLAASRGMERSMHRKPVAHRSRSSGIRRRPPFCTAVDWSRWRPCPRVSRGRQTELKDYVGISLPHAISPVPFLPVATNAEVPMLVYLLALSVGSRAKRVPHGRAWYLHRVRHELASYVFNAVEVSEVARQSRAADRKVNIGDRTWQAGVVKHCCHV